MKIAFFDFDGTITRHDTFLTFARHARGTVRLAAAIAYSLPWIIGWKLGICSNTKAKQGLFGRLYRGVSANEFDRYCHSFISIIDEDLRPDTMARIAWHKSQGHTVAIVSASIGNWIRPWAQKHGIDCVIATEIEASADGRITGLFGTPNCHGTEKVRRIKQLFALTDSDETWAYGDSSGDSAMLSMCTHPVKV